MKRDPYRLIGSFWYLLFLLDLFKHIKFSYPKLIYIGKWRTSRKVKITTNIFRKKDPMSKK